MEDWRWIVNPHLQTLYTLTQNLKQFVDHQFPTAQLSDPTSSQYVEQAYYSGYPEHWHEFLDVVEDVPADQCLEVLQSVNSSCGSSYAIDEYVNTTYCNNVPDRTCARTRGTLWKLWNWHKKTPYLLPAPTRRRRKSMLTSIARRKKWTP